MRELMLIENPSGRGRGRNPVYVAPYSYRKPSIGKRVHVPGYVKNLPGERNPRGGIMKNPIGTRAITKEWLGGMNMTDMGAALGGLASSTMLPGIIIRTADTMGQKLLKAVVAFACAAGAGFVFRNISPSAGKMAVAGGVAGALAQTISAFTGITIGQPSSRLLSRPSNPTSRVLSRTSIGQTTKPGYEDVQIF